MIQCYVTTNKMWYSTTLLATCVLTLCSFLLSTVECDSVSYHSASRTRNLLDQLIRTKRAPVLDKIFSPALCTQICRDRYRDGRPGEVEQRIAAALAPGAYPAGVNRITNFPNGSPYTFVATTTGVNAHGVSVLMPLAMRATLRRPTGAVRTSQDTPRGAATNVKNMYDGNKTGIDTGHLVAFVNGGTRDLFNFIGMTGATNNGPYKVIENFINNWINSFGYVEFNVVVSYVGTRPSEIGVKLKFFNNDGSLHSDCLDVIVLNK